MKKRLLIVDDEPAILQVFQRHLHVVCPAWEISGATNGQEALQLQAQAPFDVIITDILMPEKEGLETIMEIRRCFPAVKIIAISGGGRRVGLDVLHIAKCLGAHRTLAKPFHLQELVEAVHAVLCPDTPPHVSVLS